MESSSLSRIFFVDSNKTFWPRRDRISSIFPSNRWICLAIRPIHVRNDMIYSVSRTITAPWTEVIIRPSVELRSLVLGRNSMITKSTIFLGNLSRPRQPISYFTNFRIVKSSDYVVVEIPFIPFSLFSWIQRIKICCLLKCLGQRCSVLSWICDSWFDSSNNYQSGMNFFFFFCCR